MIDDRVIHYRRQPGELERLEIAAPPTGLPLVVAAQAMQKSGARGRSGDELDVRLKISAEPRTTPDVLNRLIRSCSDERDRHRG